MEHKTLEVKAVATDRGEFTAIAAAYSVDRVKDQIIPGAFEKTIAAWQASGKQIPLHYDHKGDPQYIIGSVDPAKMKEVEAGLYIEGNIDLEGSEVGREAWRVMKTDAMALSFGYLETKTKKRDGVNQLLELDVFEFTVTPAPVQADTRFLSLKSVREQLGLPIEPRKDVVKLAALKSLEDVQTFLDDNFPGHKITAVEDGGDEELNAKSAPQDPLVKEAWELVTPRGSRPPRVEPEPPSEPLDPAKVAREAWALAMETSGD